MNKKIELYDGEVTLEFDEVKHAYTTDGKFIPGVTSILGCLDKPALVGWAARMAAEYIREGYLARAESGEIDELSSFMALCDEAKTAHRRFSKGAADIGKTVHSFAEAYMLSGDVNMPDDPLAQNGCEAFLEWFKDNKVEVIDVEKLLFSRENWYAGTCDFYGYINDELCVMDLKTSSGLYPEMGLQLGGYAVCLEEMTGEKVKHGWIIRLDKITGLPEAYYIPIRPELKKAFLLVKAAYGATRLANDLIKEVKKATRAGTNATQTKMIED